MDLEPSILIKYTDFSLFVALFGPFLTPADPSNAPEKGQKIKTMKKTTGVTILMTKLTTLPIFTFRIACLEAWEFFDPFLTPGSPWGPQKWIKK